jgi:hypothetical protein
MKKMEQLVEELYRTRQEQNLDTVVPVIGDEGMGKSTLILQLAVKYCMERDGEPPEIEHLLSRVCYTREEFKKMMANSEKQDLIIVPDAARVLYSMDVAKSEQKEIEKDMMDVRGLEYFILMGFQSWRRMGGEIKERRAKLAAKIPRRGLIRVYSRQAMDEKVDTGDWPSATLTDKFRPLDGTELWQQYKSLDELKKRERIAAGIGDGEDEADQMSVQDVADEIADGGLEAVVSANSRTDRPYINKDLIRAEYELSHSDARAVKSLLEKEFDIADL